MSSFQFCFGSFRSSSPLLVLMSTEQSGSPECCEEEKPSVVLFERPDGGRVLPEETSSKAQEKVLRQKLYLFGHDHSNSAETALFYFFLSESMMSGSKEISVNDNCRLRIFLEAFLLEHELTVGHMINHDLHKHNYLPEGVNFDLSVVSSGVNTEDWDDNFLSFSARNFEEKYQNSYLCNSIFFFLKNLKEVYRNLTEEKRTRLDTLEKFTKNVFFVTGWESEDSLSHETLPASPSSQRAQAIKLMNLAYAESLKSFLRTPGENGYGIWRSGAGHLFPIEAPTAVKVFLKNQESASVSKKTEGKRDLRKMQLENQFGFFYSRTKYLQDLIKRQGLKSKPILPLTSPIEQVFSEFYKGQKEGAELLSKSKDPLHEVGIFYVFPIQYLSQ